VIHIQNSLSDSYLDFSLCVSHYLSAILEEFTHSSHYSQDDDCDTKGCNSIQNLKTIRKMDMNFKFEATAINLTHRTHEAKYTEQEKIPKCPV